MKDKKGRAFILLLVLILIIVIIIIFLLSLLRPKTYDEFLFEGASVYLIEDSSVNLGDYYLFKDNNELQSYYDISNITDKDFKKYNYLAIRVNYDECSEKELIPHHYIMKDKVLYVYFTYNASCGVCTPKDVYYILEMDKEIEFDDVKVEYQSNNKIDCPIDVAYKPIIYLYPKNEMNINVKLGNSNYLTTTYPKYNDSWNVYAYPNGKLIDNNTGRELYGLYWEGINYNGKVTDEGFVVKGNDTLSFLEEKLSILGLTEREADEFIIYWLPKLENNKYNYIRFVSFEEINNYMPLNVEPKPDSVIRVMMEYKPLNEKIEVRKQTLSTPERNGFVLVEWGGSLIN